MKVFSLGLVFFFAQTQADTGCADKVGKACRDDPLCDWNSKFKICSDAPTPAPTNPPTDPPTDPPTSGVDVCSDPGPTGSIVARCRKCLTQTQYTDAGCEFDDDDYSCKASGTAGTPVTVVGNCPAANDNKKTSTPPPPPMICGGDSCCVFGKAKGLAVDQDPPNGLYKPSAADEYQCAATCATFSCEYWTFDTRDNVCQLWTDRKNGPATAPTNPAERFISGDDSCQPIAP